MCVVIAVYLIYDYIYIYTPFSIELLLTVDTAAWFYALIINSELAIEHFFVGFKFICCS